MRIGRPVRRGTLSGSTLTSSAQVSRRVDVNAPIRISAVVITKGRPDELGETLTALLDCDPRPDEIVVVDGDDARSAEPTVEGLRKQAAIPMLYELSEPSRSIQRNRGVEVATGDVIVFLDDDVSVEPGVFATLAAAYKETDVAGATGKVIEPDRRRIGTQASRIRRLLFPGGPQGSLTSFGYPRRILDPERACDVEWMQGCFMSARRELARKVPLDELIAARFDGEDEDFSYRLSRLGRIRYLPEAIVNHKGLGLASTGEREREFNRDIVLVRAYLFRKNFNPTLRTRIQFGALVAILFVHRALNREWAGARGVLDGAWRVARTHQTAKLLTAYDSTRSAP